MHQASGWIKRLGAALVGIARSWSDRLPRIPASTELVIAMASLFWVLAANRGFVGTALHQRAWGEISTWLFVGSLMAMLWALHALLLVPLATRHTIKPLVTLLTLAAAAGSYFVTAYGVVLDPSMLRNVLRTEPAEAGELMTFSFALHMVLYGLIPAMVLWRADIAPRSWQRAIVSRSLLAALTLTVLIGGLWANFQPLSSWMRNQREARYLITPANIIWSTSQVLAADARGAARPREAIGTDAKPGPSWAQRTRPLVVVLVVGETARAANWGLSGYARQTTPRLAGLDLVNFPQVSACGTNTEVSLPCMFAPIGRRDYDEDRIRGQESLLNVLARAGVAVHWRDNQSGCKGVCDGIPNDTVTAPRAPGLCEGDRCLDEGLIQDLPARLRAAQGTQLWVFHMLGNHGPSYWRRYPSTFAHFRPECHDDDLRRCTPEQITNSYDNALLYTDHVLARTIAELQAVRDRVDSALIYVSDHGESLGEHGLFLHGVPHRLAPKEQIEVPMIWWSSPGLEPAAGLSSGCVAPSLRRQAQAALSHDLLFHSVLGLLDVRTALHEPSLDLFASCRQSAAQ